MSNLAIQVTRPAGAVDVSRSSSWRFEFEDTLLPVDVPSIVIAYTQGGPLPVNGASPRVVAFQGSAFQAGFQKTSSTVVVSTSGLGTKVVVTVLPEFGLKPAVLHLLEAYGYKGGNPGQEVSTTFTFITANDVVAANMRYELRRFMSQAARYGWDDFVVASPTHVFEDSLEASGSRVEVGVNTALAADAGDFLSDPPVGLDFLVNGRVIRVVAKLGEYARDPYDEEGLYSVEVGLQESGYPQAFPVVANRRSPPTQEMFTVTLSDRVERSVVYISVFLLVPPTAERQDWVWAYTDLVSFASAFSYGRYGMGAKLFAQVQEALQLIDGELG